MTIRGLFVAAVCYIGYFFSVRIFKIDWNLYQSGHLRGIWSLKVLKRHNITHVVDLEGGTDQYANHFAWYEYWPIVDGNLPDLTKLLEIAQKVQNFTSLGKNVLVHCAAGYNRSSLVNGYVLYLRGYKGKDIIKKIRKGRPGALTNFNFVRYLENLT